MVVWKNLQRTSSCKQLHGVFLSVYMEHLPFLCGIEEYRVLARTFRSLVNVCRQRTSLLSYLCSPPPGSPLAAVCPVGCPVQRPGRQGQGSPWYWWWLGCKPNAPYSSPMCTYLCAGRTCASPPPSPSRLGRSYSLWPYRWLRDGKNTDLFHCFIDFECTYSHACIWKWI